MATATIKAVVFDFFGTLTLPVSRGSQKRAVIPVAQALGVPTDRLMQVTRESFADRTLGRWGSFSQTVERAAREAGAAPSEEALEVACQLRLDGQRRHPMRLRPEAEPTLAALRAMGIAIGVLSDCSHELPMSWSELAIAPFVDAVVFSVEVGIRKPDPRVYEMIVERLAVTAGSCLYVGDGGSHELTGAANAEMTAVLLDDPEGRSAVVYDRDRWDGPSIASLDSVPGLVSRHADLAQS
jgi:putative hydrolase of the HAD superfamily